MSDKYHRHGLTHTPIYTLWANMKNRCRLNSNGKRHKDYGGRGIRVCDEWSKNPVTFFDWALSNGYKEGLTIDRIDNNGNYEPSNCRFITNKANQRNTRKNKFYLYKGEVKALCELSEIHSIKYSRLQLRLIRGWSIERAIETPPKIDQKKQQIV